MALRTFLSAKIHGARVTDANLAYEGSIGIPEDLLEEAGMLPNEAVHVWNITRGSRFQTYIIPAPRGSGSFVINGAAAHLNQTGDSIIIATFVQLQIEEIESHKARVLILDERNTVKSVAPATHPIKV